MLTIVGRDFAAQYLTEETNLIMTHLMRTIYLGLLSVTVTLAVFFMVPGCASPASTARPDLSHDVATVVANSDIEGQWQGVFHRYPYPYELTLDVGANGNGRLTARRFNSKSVAIYEVDLKLDPLSRIVAIQLGEPISQGGRVPARIAVPNMTGFYSPSMSAIGGRVASPRRDSSPHFVLGKNDIGNEFIDVSAPSARGAIRPRKILDGAFGTFFNKNQSNIEKIKQWAALFETEYPELDPHHTEFSRLYEAARPLFGDDVMVRYYGKTYDSLGRNGRNDIVQSFRENRQELQRYGGLIRGFQNSGTYTDDDIIVTVLAMRVIKAWIEASVSRLPDLPKTEEAFRSIDRIEAAYVSAGSNFLPSTRRAFSDELHTARIRISGPILDQKIKQLSESGGLVTARSIVSWEVDNAAYLQYVNDSKRQILRTNLEPNLDAILKEEVAKWKSRMMAAPVSLPGLAQTVQIYKQYGSAFGFSWHHPVVQNGLRPLIDHRKQIVNTVVPTLRTKLLNAKSQADVNRIHSKYLAAPGDPGGKAASLLATRLRELGQQDAFDRAAVLYLLALGTEAIGDYAVKDTEILDALIVGSLSIWGRNALLKEAAEELLIATDGDPSERQSIEDVLLLSTRLITGTSTEAEIVAGLQAASARVTQGNDKKLAADIALFTTEVRLKWRDNNK